MPLALLIIGAAIMVSVIRNTHNQLGKQLVADFTGSGNFLIWIAAISIVGMIGYIPSWEKPSRALLGLIILAMFLKNGGVFDQFKSAITSSIPAATPAKEPSITGPAPVKILGLNLGGSGGILGSATNAATSAATTAATGGLV
jgi:flagellar biosynthesis component FlhA